MKYVKWHVKLCWLYRHFLLIMLAT